MRRTNRVVHVPDRHQAQVVERPYPRITDGFALVRQFIAPICDEVRIFKDLNFDWYERPDGMGHEGVGEIVEVRSSSRFEVGDRVIVFPGLPCGRCSVCVLGGSTSNCANLGFGEAIEAVNGAQSGGSGLSEYRIAPESQLLKIPNDMSYEHAAATLCLLGCGYSSWLELGLRMDDTALVCGLGFVGLGAIVAAKYIGARVIGAVRTPYRRGLALEVGADWIVNPSDPDVVDQIKEITGVRQGADATIEGSGADLYQRLAIDATRRYGSVRFLGYWVNDTAPFPLRIKEDVIDKHLYLSGSHDHHIGHREKLLEMASRAGKQIDTLVTHKFPMSQIKEAFEAIASRECGKVYLYTQD